MEKALLIILINLVNAAGVQAQSSTISKDGRGWLISAGVHYFPKQTVTPNYEAVQGLTIYSLPTKASAFEVTRFLKSKGRFSTSIGLRLAQMPSDAGLDIAKDITQNGYIIKDYYKNSLPYATIKGLLNLRLFNISRFEIVQSIGTSLVLIPRGFANLQIKSFSSGSLVYYYVSKGAYNPSGVPFFSLLGQTSVIYTANKRQKWFLNASYEISPRNAIISNYTFFTKTNELKGTITRHYQHFGIQLGFFWAMKNKKYVNRDPYEENEESQ
jgi:hypothetical protein